MAAASQPVASQWSTAIHHQPRMAEQKSVDSATQRRANCLRASALVTSDVVGQSRKEILSTTRANDPPPYEEDFHIPIVYDTIASLKFQNSPLTQTIRRHHVQLIHVYRSETSSR